MLSDLNSVLIEGRVQGDPIYTGTDKDSFFLKVCSIKVNNDRSNDRTYFNIKLSDKLASTFLLNFNSSYNSRLRFIGKLAGNDSGLYIHAEHFEFQRVRENRESDIER